MYFDVNLKVRVKNEFLKLFIIFLYDSSFNSKKKHIKIRNIKNDIELKLTSLMNNNY
jgi:hypothetical protein